MDNRIGTKVATVFGCMAILLAVAAITGCSGTGGCPFASCPCNSGTSAAQAKAVNLNCPISGDKVEQNGAQPTFVRQFKGRTVAFCSQFCADQWDRLGDQAKQEKLDKVLSPSTER